VTSVENPSIAARGTHARADRWHRHLALARDHRCRGGSAVPDVSRAGRDPDFLHASRTHPLLEEFKEAEQEE